MLTNISHVVESTHLSIRMLTLRTSTEVEVFFDCLSKRTEIDPAEKAALSLKGNVRCLYERGKLITYEVFDTWKGTIRELREQALQ